jgi:hypothetical protein
MKANLEWIRQQWRAWLETDRAKKMCLNSLTKVKQHHEHVAQLFAAHCVEALEEEFEREPRRGMGPQ